MGGVCYGESSAKPLAGNSFTFISTCSLGNSSETSIRVPKEIRTGMGCIRSLTSDYFPLLTSTSGSAVHQAHQPGGASKPVQLLLPLLAMLFAQTTPWLSPLPRSNPCLPGKDFSIHAIYNCISPDPPHTCYIFLHCIYLLLKSCKMSLFILLSLSPPENKLQKGRDVSLFCSLL